MASFDIAVELVLKHEGGYTPGLANDPGGATNMGISQKAFPDKDIKDLTREEAIAIYKKDYWTDWMESLEDQQLANCALDSAVNQGLGGMTRIRNLAGLLGAVTLKSFQLERLLAYAHTGKLGFYRGWFRRSMDV